MTKIEVISQKPSKNWILAKMAIFYNFLAKKSPILIFPRVTLLTHASRHLEEDLRQFSAKTNDKS